MESLVKCGVFHRRKTGGTFGRLTLCIGLLLLGSDVLRAQQVRPITPAPRALAKKAIEWHLQSKHPQIPQDPNLPTAGKNLLDKAAGRQRLLQARVQRAAVASNLRPAASGSITGTLPGIQFRPSIPAGDIANAVAAGDFNGDGKMDFVVANGGTDDLWIYFGKGDGTFQLPKIVPLTKGVTPVYLAAASLRGNGTLDLIVAESDSDSVGVLLGNGDGTFEIETEYLLPQAPGAIVVDDFNHDGKPDVVCAMVTANNPTSSSIPFLATLFGDGTGSLGSPIITSSNFYSSVESIVSGDVNGDGLPDVLVTGPTFENSQIFLNNGNGTFKQGTTLIENGGFNQLAAGTLGDVDGDGCLDAAIADADGFVWIGKGDCKGDFALLNPVPIGDSPGAVSLTDMNGDGHLDVVTSTLPLLGGTIFGSAAGNLLTVALGDGKGNFTASRNYVGTGMSYSLAIADFNGDGHPDVVSASPDTDTATVWLNDGSAGFGFPQGEWVGVRNLINNPQSLPSFVDVNGDGKPDMVVLNAGYGDVQIATMLNDGTGRFADPITSESGVVFGTMGDYRIANFRGSGHPDFVAIGESLVFSGGAQYVVFAPGNGDGTFGTPTSFTTPGADGTMAVGDFDGDGKLDFVAVGGNPSGSGFLMSVFLGNGDGTFRPGITIPITDSAQTVGSVSVADFNGDGKLDVLVYDTGNGYWTTSSYVWEFLGKGDGTFQAGQELYQAFQPMMMANVNNDSSARPSALRLYVAGWDNGDVPSAKVHDLSRAKFRIVYTKQLVFAL